VQEDAFLSYRTQPSPTEHVGVVPLSRHPLLYETVCEKLRNDRRRRQNVSLMYKPEAKRRSHLLKSFDAVRFAIPLEH
jgi:hypothetical protein